MRLKVLILAAIFAISVMGFTPQANAADGVTTQVTVWTWSGYDMRDKYYSGINEKDTDYFQKFVVTRYSNLYVTAIQGNLKAEASIGWGQEAGVTGAPTSLDGLGPRTLGVTYTASPDVNFMYGYYTSPYSNVTFDDVADADINSFGGCFDGYHQLMRLNAFGFYVQAMQPDVVQTIGAKSTTGANDSDCMMPMMAAGYKLAVGALSFAVNGGYFTYKADKPSDPTWDGAKITIYFVNAIFKGTFGPLKVGALGFYGQNTGMWGLMSKNTTNVATWDAVNLEIANTKVMGGNANIGFDVMPKLHLGAGLGYEVCDNDTYSKKDAAMDYWVSAKISIDGTFAVVPEFKVIDKMKSISNVKEGKDMQIGFGLQATI
jgi:hypothetical protein